MDGLRLSANDINGMLKMIPAGENIDLAEAFKRGLTSKTGRIQPIQRYFNYTVYAGNMDARGMSIKTTLLMPAILTVTSVPGTVG